jgi:hypothetical protein
MAVPKCAHLPLGMIVAGNQQNLFSEILLAKRMTAGEVGFLSR